MWKKTKGTRLSRVVGNLQMTENIKDIYRLRINVLASLRDEQKIEDEFRPQLTHKLSLLSLQMTR